MFSILKKYLSQSIFKFLSSFSKLISFDLKKGSTGFQFILPASSYYMYNKNYLEENIYQLQKIYDAFKIKHINYAIDIGGNIGLVSLSLLKINPNLKIIVFEPSLYNFKYLKKNLGNYKNVFLNNFALSDKSEFLELGINDNDLHYSRIFNTGIYTLRHSNQYNMETVKTKIFDQLNIQIDTQNYIFIKIDVEGFELKVLRGMKKFLQKTKSIIKIEINYFSLNKDLKNLNNILNFLHKQNFKIFLLEELINNKVEEVNLLKIYELFNLKKTFELIVRN